MQKHRSTRHMEIGPKKWRASLGQRIWPEIVEDGDAAGTGQFMEALEYCGQDPTSTILHPGWCLLVKAMWRNLIWKVLRLDEFIKSLTAAIRGLEEGKTRFRWTREEMLIDLSLGRTMEPERRDAVPETVKKKHRHCWVASKMWVNEKRGLR